MKGGDCELGAVSPGSSACLASEEQISYCTAWMIRRRVTYPQHAHSCAIIRWTVLRLWLPPKPIYSREDPRFGSRKAWPTFALTWGSS